MKKIYKMRVSFLSAALLAAITFGWSSCKLKEIPNPNDPSLETIETNASLSDILNLVAGTESAMRNDIVYYYDGTGVIGREFYRFSGSDPRFTSDLLGKGNAVLDDNTFYTTRSFTARYRVIRNCNILLNAVANTKAPLTVEEKKGLEGFANTVIAYQLLLNLNMQYKNGVRTDVADPDNMGPFLSYERSLESIAVILDEGAKDLNDAGGEFLFALSSGFSGFDTPALFRKFNRSLAARVALYREKYNEAIAFLNESFLDLNGDIYSGVYHVFSISGGDIQNPLFLPANSPAGKNARVTHPGFVTDAEQGDTRLSKVLKRDAAAFQDDLSGDYDVMIYTSISDPIALIRNEELILIYGEAYAQLDNGAEAMKAIGVIRSAAGLPVYSGGTGKAELIDEILHQRRYSLFAEGHRWVDMRRYGRLDQLPVDRTGDNVWEQFPRPMTEQQGG